MFFNLGIKISESRTDIAPVTEASEIVYYTSFA